jgi:uncharacterized protein (TIGR04255 family)
MLTPSQVTLDAVRLLGSDKPVARTVSEMDNDPARIIGYNVYQTTNPALPKKEWKKLNDQPLPQTRYKQDRSDLEPGRTYYSYVTSVNAIGMESEPSEILSFTAPVEIDPAADNAAFTLPEVRLPKKITPVPVKEAIAEIRFESSFPADAIFGVVYNRFKDEYPELERLPILQMPEMLRTADPNLRFQPYYRLRKENFLMNIGPSLLSLAVTEPYPGWNDYLHEILNVFGKLQGLNFINKVTRAAIRYTDFFEGDIFSGINLSILMNNQRAPTYEAYFRTIIPRERFRCLLQIGNSTRVQSGGLAQMGSIIDVDTFCDERLEDFFENTENYLNEAHLAQKQLFFSLLKPEFLEKFNPEY